MTTSPQDARPLGRISTEPGYRLSLVPTHPYVHGNLSWLSRMPRNVPSSFRRVDALLIPCLRHAWPYPAQTKAKTWRLHDACDLRPLAAGAAYPECMLKATLMVLHGDPARPLLPAGGELESSNQLAPVNA